MLRANNNIHVYAHLLFSTISLYMLIGANVAILCFFLLQATIWPSSFFFYKNMRSHDCTSDCYILNWKKEKKYKSIRYRLYIVFSVSGTKILHKSKLFATCSVLELASAVLHRSECTRDWRLINFTIYIKYRLPEPGPPPHSKLLFVLYCLIRFIFIFPWKLNTAYEPDTFLTYWHCKLLCTSTNTITWMYVHKIFKIIMSHLQSLC